MFTLLIIYEVNWLLFLICPDAASSKNCTSHILCCGCHYETYIGISPYHTLCCGFYYETYISISPYHTLCCVFHYETYIGISPYHTLCCVFHYEAYICIIPYRTLCCGFHYETYICISPYRTLSVDWAQCMVELCHVWLDRVRKYKRCSFFVRYVKIQHIFNE